MLGLPSGQQSLQLSKAALRGRHGRGAEKQAFVCIQRTQGCGVLGAVAAVVAVAAAVAAVLAACRVPICTHT